MVEAYYFKIKDICEFLKYYNGIYERDYNKAKARKILSLIPGLKGKKVMDVGCGGGFYSLAAYNKKCRDVTLVDLSPVCVKGARMNLQERTILRPEGIVAEVTHIPFRNEYFDLVLCIDLIEHVQKHEVLLREISRILKDGGLMLIATQNSNSINYILEAAIQRYILKNKRWIGWDPNHLRFYTPKSLSLLLKNCGFAPIEVTGTYFVPYFIATSFNRINRKLSSALYHIIKLINDKIEIKHKVPLSTFGWGIMYLCVKIRSPEVGRELI